jgi:hypothetical protein
MRTDACITRSEKFVIIAAIAVWLCNPVSTAAEGRILSKPPAAAV